MAYAISACRNQLHLCFSNHRKRCLLSLRSSLFRAAYRVLHKVYTYSPTYDEVVDDHVGCHSFDKDSSNVSFQLFRRGEAARNSINADSFSALEPCEPLRKPPNTNEVKLTKLHRVFLVNQLRILATIEILQSLVPLSAFGVWLGQVERLEMARASARRAMEFRVPIRSRSSDP